MSLSLYLLIQDLSLNLKLTILTRLANHHRALEICPTMQCLGLGMPSLS